MALVGTISGSNNTSNTAITGTLVIANTTTNFPSIPGDAVLFVSGAIGVDSKAVFGGDVLISGTMNMTNLVMTGTAIIEANSSAAALRITQQGAGEAIRVEDSANPDTSPFVVTAAGRVGIGTASPNGALVVTGTDVTVPTLVVRSADATTDTFYVTSSAAAGFYAGIVRVNQGNQTNKVAFQVENIGAGSSGIMMNSAGGGYLSIENFNLTPQFTTVNRNLSFNTVGAAYDSSQVSFRFTEYSKAVSYPNQKTFLISGNVQGFKTGSYFEVEKSGSITLLQLRGDTQGNELYVSGNLLVSSSIFAKNSVTIRGDETADQVRMQFQASDLTNRFTIESDFDASTANDLLGFRSTTTDNIIVLKGNGNVGFGNAAPAKKIEVTGDAKINAGAGVLALEVTGNIRATDKISSLGNLEALQSSGDEGGEIFLSKSATNTTLNTGVTIDVYQNKLRFFETAGSNRGGYFDLTTLGGGVVNDIAGRNIPLSFFGDASDGSATLNATGSVGWASLAGSVYTMTRDAYLRNLTINTGVTLRVQGYQPFVRGTLTVSGTYEAKGNDATGGTGGSAFSNVGTWNYTAGGGGNGGGPTTGNATGSNGTGAGSNSIGGGGGSGGGAGAQAGGNGNTTVGPVAAVTGWRDVGFFVRRRVFNVAATQSINGSGGGGGGAVEGDAVNSGTGGGGGGAGPNCYVLCNILDNAGTIRSLGGNGANGTSAGGTTKAGGGGGGSGGGVIVAANTVVNLGTITSSGGALGNGANGGANGNAGTAGTVLILTGS